MFPETKKFKICSSRSSLFNGVELAFFEASLSKNEATEVLLEVVDFLARYALQLSSMCFLILLGLKDLLRDG
jgi:hypothetical protein